MTLPWPEMQSTSRPGETVRQMLDYIVWIAQDLMLLGAYSGADVGPWRRQVGIAYRSLVNPMMPGYGDPYPPDVPPPRSPGLWPDVAAHDLPGMTVRHQLAVIGLLADASRQGMTARVRPEVLHDLEMRIARARTALDHGAGKPMPSAARTEPRADLIQQAQAEDKAVRDRMRRLARPARALAGKAKPGAKATAKGAGKAAKGRSPKAKAAKGGPARKPPGAGKGKGRG